MSAESEERQRELDHSWDFDPRTGVAIAVACMFAAAITTLVVLMVRAFKA